MGWTMVKKSFLSEFHPTRIGDDLWLGFRCSIKDGVTIGDGAIVDAGAVVVTDIEPYAIYGGVPAKLTRYRFDRSKIDFLMALKWWDRDETWLYANLASMQDLELLMNHLASSG
jgi:serine acetyltransferase